ncbi:MAG: LptE family protein [Syntrophothermus sp.]
MKLVVNLKFLFLFVLVLSLNGCCPYSFTGGSTPEHIKTIAIPVADDRSGSGEPGLRELLTNKLNQKFIDDNTLQVADRTNANSILQTTITSLVNVPAEITAGENVQRRRLTITVQAVYKDLIKKKTVFDRSFSNYALYPAGGSIDDRKAAIDEALNNITEDILLNTVSGW